jgi:hypothetical protein
MSSRRPSASAASPSRPIGPRCHGGASSLLRLGPVAVPKRPAGVRATATWREVDVPAASVEHVVRRPLCAPGATLWS